MSQNIGWARNTSVCWYVSCVAVLKFSYLFVVRVRVLNIGIMTLYSNLGKTCSYIIITVYTVYTIPPTCCQVKLTRHESLPIQTKSAVIKRQIVMLLMRQNWKWNAVFSCKYSSAVLRYQRPSLLRNFWTALTRKNCLKKEELS